MIDIERLAAGVAADLLKTTPAPANPRRLIEDAFRRGLRLGLSIRHPVGLHPAGTVRKGPGAMDNDALRRRIAARKAETRRVATDLVIACERAASRRLAKRNMPAATFVSRSRLRRHRGSRTARRRWRAPRRRARHIRNRFHA